MPNLPPVSTPTSGGTSPQRPRGGERAAHRDETRARGGARSGQPRPFPAVLAIPVPNHVWGAQSERGKRCAGVASPGLSATSWLTRPRRHREPRQRRGWALPPPVLSGAVLRRCAQRVRHRGVSVGTMALLPDRRASWGQLHLGEGMKRSLPTLRRVASRFLLSHAHLHLFSHRARLCCVFLLQTEKNFSSWQAFGIVRDVAILANKHLCILCIKNGVANIARHSHIVTCVSHGNKGSGSLNLLCLPTKAQTHQV